MCASAGSRAASRAGTYALESLIICSFSRGLSVRDVEAALEKTFEEPMIATSTVAGVCRDTRERYGGLDPGLAAVAVAGIDLGREQDGGELRIAPWLGTGAVGEVGAMPAPPPAP